MAGGYTHENPREPSASPRVLMRWDADKHEEFLLCIERALCDRGINFEVLDAAGQYMSGAAKPTASAIHQHLIKLRNKRKAAGKAIVPQHKARRASKLPASPQSPSGHDNDLSGFGGFDPAIGQALTTASTPAALPESNKRKRVATLDDNDVIVNDTPTKPQQEAYTAPPIPLPSQQQAAFPPPFPQDFAFPAAAPLPSAAPFPVVWGPNDTINPAELSVGWEGEVSLPAGPGPAFQGNFGEQGDGFVGGEFDLGGFLGGQIDWEGNMSLPEGDDWMYASGN